MIFQSSRQFLQALLQSTQRQLIVFLAVYVMLFGPLLTGWQFGGGRVVKFPTVLQAMSAPNDLVLCGSSATTPSNLLQCSTTPLRSLPRIFVVPGTFVLALLLIALLLVAFQSQLVPFVRVALPPPLDDPPPRYPPRSL